MSDQPTDWRMNAYYYGFSRTGNTAIDRILSAVACAGKAFHHTEDWSNPTTPYPHLRGDSAVDWIQNAANDAAASLPAPPDAAQDTQEPR